MPGRSKATACSMNILLVEDDAGVGRFVERGLLACGYDVRWERDGSRVMDLLAKDCFSGAVIDLGLPDCDGIDLCRAIRDVESQLPVLMLTARGSLQDRLEGFAVGADDYLPKPFAFDELVARLGAIVRRGAANVSSDPHFGTLSIDVAKGAALIGDDSLTLSRREFALLSALVARGGEVATRAALSAAVWGTEDVSENALDVYVSYLRRRLAKHPAAPAIATVRGVGFKLAISGAERTTAKADPFAPQIRPKERSVR